MPTTTTTKTGKKKKEKRWKRKEGKRKKGKNKRKWGTEKELPVSHRRNEKNNEERTFSVSG